MISLRSKPNFEVEQPELKGFDDYDLSLGDVLRGERATQNKSLNDLKRELRIQPSYLLAIEESDPSAFDTPGFIAGYVRAYAKYLGLDPDWAFKKFCEESGFATAHGMSEEAKPRRREEAGALGAVAGADPFAKPNTPYTPPSEPFFERVNFRALGSTLVLLLLIGGLGYGAMNVVQKVQQVQVVPVEQPPVVATDIDPLTTSQGDQIAQIDDPEISAPTSVGDLDRLYKLSPELESPAFVQRDGPIGILDPAERGVFAERLALSQLPRVERSTTLDPALLPEEVAAALPEKPVSEVVMFAVRDVWARAVAPDGTRVFQGIMQPGQEFDLPQTEQPVRLRAGNSGSLYFRIDGVIYGPAGPGTSVVKRVSMARADLLEKYTTTENDQDPALAAYIEERNAPKVPGSETLVNPEPTLVENQN